MLALGISDLERNAAVALVDEVGPVAAIEEDKLSRTAGEGGFPRRALEFCLKQAGARPDDVDTVALASRLLRGWLREEGLRLSMAVRRFEVPYGTGTLGQTSRQLASLAELRQLFPPRIRVDRLDHHVCHAASVFLPADAERALVITLDESGDGVSGLVAVGEGERISPLHTMTFPNSFGWVYSAITALIGFRPHRDEAKTQWLSREGQPRHVERFRELVGEDGEGLPVLDRRHLARRAGGGWRLSDRFIQSLGLSGRMTPSASDRADLARSVQEWLEDAVVRLAERLRARTGLTQLFAAGGVFLNVCLVDALERRTGFERVVVPPAPSNAGTAMGAALLARSRWIPKPPRLRHLNPFLGPGATDDDIKRVLDNCKIIYQYFPQTDRLVDATVRLLLDDKSVAWHQGRAEFGLRSLGNRSILASPFSPYAEENLNQYVKHRERFHPFALAVPAESAAELFECTANSAILGSLGRVKSTVAGLERFAFDGNRVRVHTVTRRDQEPLWTLLTQFGRQAPAPVLVNTSFNLFGEPLVSEPREAIRSFYAAGIDALVMGSFLVAK